MASNEELVELIKEGNTEQVTALWEQINKFIYKVAKHTAIIRRESYNNDLLTEMVHECFLYLHTAIETYDINKGYKFLTWYANYFPNAFQNALYGGRTKKAIREPLNNYEDIEKPLSDTEDLTIIDTLEDKTALQEINKIVELSERHYQRKQILIALRKLKRTNPNGTRIFLYLLSNYDATPPQAIEQLQRKYKNISYNDYRSGKEKLKEILTIQFKKDNYENIDLYRGMGVRTYKENIFTSGVERIALAKVNKEMHERKKLKRL